MCGSDCCPELIGEGALPDEFAAYHPVRIAPLLCLGEVVYPSARTSSASTIVYG